MRGAVRLYDLSMGHNGYPPSPAIEASLDTFVNDRGQVRLYDAFSRHCRKKCHGRVQAEGSPNTFVNGKPAAREYDFISCGDHCRDCSPNVFIN